MKKVLPVGRSPGPPLGSSVVRRHSQYRRRTAFVPITTDHDGRRLAALWVNGSFSREAEKERANAGRYIELHMNRGRCSNKTGFAHWASFWAPKVWSAHASRFMGR